MSTHYVSPKLLLEFYKGQKVPPLVKKYQYFNHFDRSQSPSRRHTSGNSDDAFTTKNGNMNTTQNQIIQLQKQLEVQVQQNRELRLIIKQMQEKLQKMKEVNEQLIIRIQEIQKRNISLSESFQNQRRDINRKVRNEIYKEVQEYLVLSIQKFTEKIMTIKISPIVENKLEQFLEEILNINNLSVKKSLNPSLQHRTRFLFDEKQADRTIKQIVGRHSKSKSKSRQKQRELEASKYSALLQKLNKQKEQIRPGKIVSRQNISPERWQSASRIRRTGRRPRIFTRNFQTQQKQRSRQINKQLDF